MHVLAKHVSTMVVVFQDHSHHLIYIKQKTEEAMNWANAAHQHAGQEMKQVITRLEQETADEVNQMRKTIE